MLEIGNMETERENIFLFEISHCILRFLLTVIFVYFHILKVNT